MMDTSEFDIEFLAQKLSENPQSPLFARLADLYLGKEQTVEALKLCEEGVQLFPDYYAGHLVQGKIHLALKEYSKARIALERARELSPHNHTIAGLLSSIPKQPDESTRTTDENYFIVAEEQPTAEVIAGTELPVGNSEMQIEPAVEEINDIQSPAKEPTVAYVPEKTYMTFDEYFVQHSEEASAPATMTLDEYLGSSPASPEREPEKPYREPTASASAVPGQEMLPTLQHEVPEPVFASPEQAQLFAEMMGETPAQPKPASPSIDELAEKLQKTEKIVPSENYQSPSPVETSKEETPGMVTPTLAEIYASQGEYSAAIQAYEILQFSRPDKAGEYQKRIRELQQKQMEKEGLI
jgi:tetratricopeptide (TPR) repeat protein